MIVEDFPDVPPAVFLLYEEIFLKASCWSDARKLLRSLLPELKVQSRIYESHRFSYGYLQTPKGEFNIHLDGGLDLFGDGGGCRSLGCRIAAAERLCRSLGLMADTIWMTDYLSSAFCDFGRTTNAKLDEVIADTMVLGVLIPLINAKILKFKSSWMPTCASCLEHFDKKVADISNDLFKALEDQFSLMDMTQGSYALDTGALFEPPLIFEIHALREQLGHAATLSKFSKTVVEKSVRSAVWGGRDAAASHGSIFSNSKVGLAGLLHQEGRFNGLGEFRVMGERRNIDLPWVSDLSPEQIVELRSEASKALPLFRERFASKLLCESGNLNSSNPLDLIAELRYQAEEVRNELKIITQQGKRFWKTPFTLLNLGAVALGLATDERLSAVSGLLSLWQFLGTHNSSHDKDVETLQCRPGYVLLKAQDLLSHSH